jgi:hypothetical protein
MVDYRGEWKAMTKRRMIGTSAAWDAAIVARTRVASDRTRQ